jgi:uncharacterized protein (DUF1501 family)
MVIPFAEKNYATLRPTLSQQVQVGGPNPNGGIDLDGKFALHPALQPLKALWDKGSLAIVEATGSPDASRSHFEAQESMESGAPGKLTGDGWLNRALPLMENSSPLQAIAMGNSLPRTLRGDRSAIALNDPRQFQMGGATLLESLYASTPDPRLGKVGRDTFAAMKMIQDVNQNPIPIGPNAPPVQYGAGAELGRGLQQLARLIKADTGVEAAFAEMDGWDHHSNENPQISNMQRQLAQALTSFAQDLGDRMEDVVVVTMSEFGRTAVENGNAGTDHGTGSLMMVLGGSVNGGKIYGKWPGLEREQLFEGRDLAATTDYRAVVSELLTGHMGQKNLARVFPGYTPPSPLGLLRG